MPLRTASNDYRLHVLRLPGKRLHRDTRNNLLAALEQRHLPARDQRIVVLRDVTDGVPFAWMSRIFPLAFRRVVFGTRKRRHELAIRVTDGIPSAMIKMQVRIDDNVDVLRSNSGRREIIEQPRRLPVKL